MMEGMVVRHSWCSPFKRNYTEAKRGREWELGKHLPSEQVVVGTLGN